MKPATRAAVLEGSVVYAQALRQGLSVQEAELLRLRSAESAYGSFQAVVSNKLSNTKPAEGP